MKCLHYIYVI